MFFQSVLIAFAAGALLVENTVLSGLVPNPILFCSVVFLTFSGYRISPWISAMSTKNMLFLRINPVVYSLLFFVIPFALFFVFRTSNVLSALIVAVGFYWFYHVGFFNRFQSLRKNKWAKPMVIALVWTLFCSASLCFSFGSLNDLSICHLSAISCFFFVLSMSLLCDVADSEVDRASGVKTLAVCYGPKSISFSAVLIGAIPVLLNFLYLGNASQKWTISLLATAACCMAAAICVLLLPAKKSRLSVDVLLFMKPFILILVSI